MKELKLSEKQTSAFEVPTGWEFLIHKDIFLGPKRVKLNPVPTQSTMADCLGTVLEANQDWMVRHPLPMAKSPSSSTCHQA